MALILGALPALAIGLLIQNNLALDPETATVDQVSGVFVIGVVSWLAMTAVTVLVQAALTRATVADSEGRRADLRECLKAGFAVVLPLVALIVLWTMGIAAGLMLLIVPGVILILMWAVAIPVLVEERSGIFAAFGRSRELTKGNRWKILGVLMVMVAAYWLLSMALGAVGVTSAAMAAGGSLEEALAPAALLGNLLPSTIFNLAWGTIQPSMYVELRGAHQGENVGDLQEVFA